jgi:putative ABC transport system permease protein
VVYGAASRVSLVTGTDNDYFIAQDWPLAEGRQFLDTEIRAGRAACIVGQTVREKLFGLNGPVGQSIRVRNVSCEVIGVLEAKGESSMGTDRDDVVMIPLRTFQRRFAGNSDINFISISAQDGVDTARVQAGAERLLRERRTTTKSGEDDFTVRDMRQVAQTTEGTTILLTRLLGAVAAVSLLVGGIGIMNIMLVSVTERTREIGIRLAIGALEGQVLTQFLVEATTLSLLGGLLGIAAGLGLAWFATNALDVPFVIDATVAAMAFGFSALVGVVFGYFPARRAARLNPIDALRHE